MTGYCWLTSLITLQFESFIQYEMSDPPVGKFCTLGDLLTSENLIIIIGIPMYEFFICPIIQNYVPTIMKKIGIGIVLDIAAVLSAFILDFYINVPGHSNELKCVLVSNVTASPTSSGFIIIPMILDTSAELLVSISGTF